MSRRFQRDVDGILLFDKPLGLSSNAALQQVRSLFAARKSGHAGSLDPLASGLLPVCFGHATKVCGRLLDAGKTYLVDVQLGARTESLDCETPVIEQAAVPLLDEEAVIAVLRSFSGEQLQVPPMHSALKFQGQRLYELARRGETVERVPRRILIRAIELRQLAGTRLEFEVSCSKGTYIRSLAADIAARLGTLGYLAGLRRLSVDPFGGLPIHTLAELERVRSDGGMEALDRLLLGSDAAFPEIAGIHLDAEATQALMLGQTVRTHLPAGAHPPAGGGSFRAYDPAGRFLGLVEGQPDGRVRPVRLFVSTGEQTQP